MNHCGINTWLTVKYLETCLPSLRELGLARNAITDIDMVTQGQPVSGFHHLQSLDLSGTGMTRWTTQVALFSKLPELRLLSLNENGLEAIEPLYPSIASSAPSASAQQGGGFEKIEALHLSGNAIASWSSIDALNAFPSLVGLRFTNNPVTRGMGQSEARQLIVARVSALTRLNGAEVSKRERAEAEKSYVRRVARELTNNASGISTRASGEGAAAPSASFSSQQQESILKQHPRWQALLKLHGDGGGVSNSAGGTCGLAKEMLNVKLISMASSSMTMSPVEKKLPGTLTVGLVKQLFQKLYKLEQNLQVIYYKTDKNAPPTMLDEDDETLTYFGVTSGCEIYMNERDLKAEAREEEARRREEKERLEEQMKQIDLLDSLKRANVGLHTASAQLAAAAGGGGDGKESK